MSDKEIKYLDVVVGIYDEVGEVGAIDYLGFLVMRHKITSAECRKIMSELITVWQQDMKGEKTWR